MSEALSLLRNAPDDGRVGRTDACHSDPRRKVDDVIAVDIDQDAATGSLDEDRHGDAHTRGEFRATLRLQLLGDGTWDAGCQDATLLWLRHVVPPSRWAVATLRRNQRPSLGAIRTSTSTACAFRPQAIHRIDLRR
jgi:hypothetical protein